MITLHSIKVPDASKKMAWDDYLGDVRNCPLLWRFL